MISDPQPDETGSRSWLVGTGLFAVLVVYVTLRELGSTAYDDSYFFQRFAIHFLEHGVFAWNLEDGPVYGSTSQLFQGLATLVTAGTRTHFVVAIRVVNAVALCGLGAVLMRWCSRATSNPWHGQALALLGLGTPMVLTTVITGMETAIALALLAVVLTKMVPAHRDAASPMSPAAAAVLTVLVYSCRPDAAVLPFVAYAGSAALRREIPKAYLAWLAGSMVVVLLSAWAYYGTPLPLPFYMKTVGLQSYGEHFVGLGWHEKQLHFGLMLAFAAPLVFIVATGRRRGLALALAVAALWGYHLSATNEIMGYRGRFYVPGVVALVMAAAQAWDGFVARRSTVAFVVVWIAAVVVAYRSAAIPTHEGFFISTVAWSAYAGTVVAGAAILVLPDRIPAWSRLAIAFIAIFAGTIAWKPPRSIHAPDDRTVMRRHAREVTTVRGIFDVARCLPSDEPVYHSEMGVTGVVLIDRRVVDLAGIVSKGPGIEGKSFQTLCEADRPAAIFLPHRNYKAQNAEIQAAPCFADYVRVVDRSSSPLYVRRDHHDAFLQCATDVHRWRGG